MAKRKRKRISNSVEGKLKRLERNAKAKQSRIKKKHGINVDFRYKQIEDLTPKQAELYEAKLQKFTSRNTHQYKRINNEFSVPLRDYQRFQEDIKQANIYRTQMREKVDLLVKKSPLAEKSGYSGSMLDYYRGLLGNPKMHFLDPLTGSLTGTHSPKEFEMKAKLYRKYANEHYIEDRVRDMKRNYIKGILNPERGIISGADPEKARRLARRLRRMPLQDFYAMYLSEENLDWTYIYNELDKDMMAELVNSSIDRAYAGEYVNGEQDEVFLNG